MDLESFFIDLFPKRYIGDDGAVIGKYIYSKDAFFEDIHFKRDWLSLYEIAQKAFLVNISDAIAMGAKPKYALLSVALPKNISKSQAQELAQGFLDIAKKWDIEIIGGDTLSNTKLDITITLISMTKKPLLRKGLKVGDLLAYTGEVGKSARELRKLLRFSKVFKYSKFKNITLRDEFIKKTKCHLRIGMDISDGIFTDMERLAKINRVGFDFFVSFSKEVGCSGEEYEMIIGFDKRKKKAIIQRAKQTRTPLHIFAQVKRKGFKNRCKGHHFG